MSKWDKKDLPRTDEIEDYLAEPSPAPLNKDMLREVFLELMKLPKNANEHWLNVMSHAVEITRHIQKL